MTPVQLFGIGYNFSFEKFYYPKDWLVVKYTYKVNNNEVISKTEQIEIINYYLIRNRQDNRKEFFSGAINVYDKNISEAIQSITSTIANDINSVAK